MAQQLGFIGLGKMGKNMVLNLLEHGVNVVGYNRTKEVTEEFNNSKNTIGHFTPSFELHDLAKHLTPPRIVWLMVPNGAPVDDVISQLISAGLAAGDTIIDGGNCFYKDTVRRAKDLETKGIHYIDCGTSGGLEGARHGACLMLGGEEDIVQDLTWLWDTLSGQGDALSAQAGLQDLALQDHALRSWTYFGPAGAGHFVKMVHNGVEYGMNQALGEGFEILSKGPYSMDFARVAHNWSHGSVIRGWLVELLAKAFDKDPKLDTFEGKVGGGETGKWTVDTAKELGVDATVLEDALKAREKSQTKPTFAGKVVSALRAGYGGHAEPGNRNNPINK